ncbi:MAG: tetratricopeptide repeat protein [Planctomycetota bacterium]
MRQAFFLSFAVAAATLGSPLHDVLPPEWRAQTLPERGRALEHPAYFEQLDIAAAEVHAGRYRQALITLHELDDTPEVLTLRGEALGRLGKLDEARAVLEAANTADAAVVLGDLLIRDLRPDDALEILRPHGDDLNAKVVMGRALEEVGDLDGAREIYQWFVDEPQSFLERWTDGDTGGRWSAAFEDAATLTAIGTALDRWATLNGKYREFFDLNDTILRTFTTSYDLLDREYWPARVAAARFLLERGDAQAATEELIAAYNANPHDADVLALLAETNTARWDFAKADRAITDLAQVNPASPIVALARIDNLLKQRRTDAAEQIVEELTTVRPNHLRILGVRAALHALQLRDDEAATVLEQVEALDPDNATAFATIGRHLAGLRQYDRAEAMLTKAVERAPWWSVPRNDLGHLLVQSGKEDAARLVLEEAFAIDPYNRQTLNYMRVLEQMSRFDSFETEHFRISYHPDFDEPLARISAEYLESVYDEMTERFNYEPPFKTHIQWFPTNDAFAVRVTGDPFVGALGACTGPVVAMRSPGDPKVSTYDWQETLRHEFAHTITLTKTGNRIAHWMTEGLSVTEEYGPITWSYVPLLNMAVSKDELFPLNRLTWGFVRPRRPFDRQLAYAQSGWVCEFIDETYGPDAINELLIGFRDGKAQGPLFEEVLGEDENTVFEKFRAWAVTQTESWGYDEKTAKRYGELRPEADALVKARQWEDARDAWEQLLAMRPNDPLPHQRLAGLYMRTGQRDQAIEMLVALTDREEQDNRYAKLAGRLLKEDGRLAEARDVLEHGTRIDFYDPAVHALLGDVYEALGDDAAADRSREIIGYIEQMKQRRKDGHTR